MWTHQLLMLSLFCHHHQELSPAPKRVSQLCVAHVLPHLRLSQDLYAENILCPRDTSGKETELSHYEVKPWSMSSSRQHLVQGKSL